jgi:hypothetical protein
MHAIYPGSDSKTHEEKINGEAGENIVKDRVVCEENSLTHFSAPKKNFH